MSSLFTSRSISALIQLSTRNRLVTLHVSLKRRSQSRFQIWRPRALRSVIIQCDGAKVLQRYEQNQIHVAPKHKAPKFSFFLRTAHKNLLTAAKAQNLALHEKKCLHVSISASVAVSNTFSFVYVGNGASRDNATINMISKLRCIIILSCTVVVSIL